MTATPNYTSRLYLDVDGVLNAENPAWTRRTSGIATSYHDGMGTKYRLIWSPDLIAALDRIRIEHHMELVWLTTWLEHDSTRGLPPVFRGLEGGRPLQFPDREDGRYISWLWKADALERDQRTHGALPFIWADDENGEWTAFFDPETLATPHLILSPHYRVGLTPDDVDALAAFAAEHDRPVVWPHTGR